MMQYKQVEIGYVGLKAITLLFFLAFDKNLFKRILLDTLAIFKYYLGVILVVADYIQFPAAIQSFGAVIKKLARAFRSG